MNQISLEGYTFSNRGRSLRILMYQRNICLEGSTFSNRGRSLRILMYQRNICLEGSTFSNRGRSLRILITYAIGCLEGCTLQMVYCLPDRCSFNPSNPETPSPVTKSIGFLLRQVAEPSSVKVSCQASGVEHDAT